MKSYTVQIPIAGHITVDVEADSEEDAIEKAMEKEFNSDTDDLMWETLRSFNSGNVCHCPSPWEAEVTEN